MVGWSRGAVTCFMMANKLFDSQIMIPVRIFALDPVPGMTNFQDSRTTLPATVCDITVVYARDEQSMGFDALVPKLVGSTRARYHILPGKHATVAGNANADGDNGPYSPNLGAPGKIARHLAVSWLRDNNAAISSGSLGDFELLKLYNEILRDDKTYRAMKRFQPDSKILHSFDTDKKGNEARSYHDTPGKTYGSPFSTTADRISGLQGETEINEQGDFVNSHHRELWARSSAIKRHSIGVRYTARGAPDDRLRTEIGRSIEAFGSSIISKIRF